VSVRTVTVLENISDLTLLVETEIMEGQIYALNLEINRLIDPECGPCPDHWIHSRQKCYLFYDEPAPWKTWEQSQSFCQDRLASLVVIGDLEEQKFVSNHTKYFISLMSISCSEILFYVLRFMFLFYRFWMKQTVTTPAPKALVVPRQNPSESWKKADNVFLNKFICERYSHEVSSI
uniref:C-type lectin domain-containing protein n=1 Tax=Poecilia formosa TaxID=48698 RepID=A0A096M1K1_POEFO